MSTTTFTTEEIIFFKEHGYVIKKKLIPKEICNKALDKLWEVKKPFKMERDKPDTYYGPIDKKFRTGPNESLHVIQDYKWQVRSFGTEPAMLNLITNNMKDLATELLGERTIEPVTNGNTMGTQGTAWPYGPTDPAKGPTEGIRGIYVTLPHRPDEPNLNKLIDFCHTDGHPMQLGVVALLEDCPANGGAFKVWPKSHKRFYPTMPLAYDQLRIPFYEQYPSMHTSAVGQILKNSNSKRNVSGIYHTKEYLHENKKVNKDTIPVDCHGGKGDVVFWHHRIGHMAGHNLIPGHLRIAMLYDFNTPKLDMYRLAKPNVQNMWADWSKQLQELTINDLPNGEFSKELLTDQGLLNNDNNHNSSNNNNAIGSSNKLVFIFHANGFNKGTYRPLVQEIALQLNGSAILKVDEVNQPQYVEHYEIVDNNNNNNILNIVLVDLIGHGDGPTLESIGASSTNGRMGIYNAQGEHVINIVETYKKMFQPDKTYSFGHSLGGGCTVHALLNYGSSNNKRNSTLLFDKVLLFEPMQLFNPSAPGIYGTRLADEDYFEKSPRTEGTLRRKNGWDTLNDARNYFYNKTFYKSWDTRCLDNYMMDGLTFDEERKQYVLKCTPLSEALLFASGINPETYDHKLQNSIYLKDSIGIANTKIKVLYGDVPNFISKQLMWSEEKVFEVFDSVIKTFRENIDWDQVNGGHLYPIEDVSGFVHMMVDEFELGGDYADEEEGNVASSVVFSKL